MRGVGLTQVSDLEQCSPAVGAQHPGISVANAGMLFQSVWAGRWPGGRSVPGDGEAGDPRVTLKETLAGGEKRVWAEAQR